MLTISIVHKFIEDGFVVFPLAPHSKQPRQGTSGHLHWELEDSTEALERGEFEGNNVAIQTGARSGIVVIDIDPRNGGTLEAVEELFGCEIQTRTHSTARSGTHLFFRYPAHLDHIPSVPGKLGAGIDIKADGGYVVAPPSSIADGVYAVTSSSDIQDLPAHIVSRIAPTKRDVPLEHYQYAEGWWSSVKRWHEQNVTDAANAVDGERDDTVYRMLVRSMQLSFTVPDSVLSKDSILSDFQRLVPYYIKGLGGKAERAYTFAEANPRQHPHTPDLSTQEIEDDDWTIVINPTDYAPDTSNLAADRLNDVANARRVQHLILDKCRYVPGEGWFVWTGRVWQRESENSEGILEIVANANGMLHLDMAELESQRPSTKDERAFVTRMNNMPGIRATLEKLQATRKLRLDVSQIDAHPHLLTVLNGTIDLRTGDLLAHDSSYMLTRLVPFAYDASARAERWEKFLVEVMPSHPELVSFLQRLVGYGITGEISEHAMCIHYGRGRNGKSVFLDALNHVFGSISASADWRSFAQKQSGGGGARSDIARLRGARLVTVSEGDAHTRLDEAQIKRMVSGDVITARQLYQSEIEFQPTFLLQMATNAKPDFRGADEGLWNRVKLIPWTRYFEEHERDHYLTDTLRAEAEGILAWSVRGAVEWYAGGLQEPASIREATREYRDSADELGGFVDSIEHGGWLVPDETGEVPASWLVGLYKIWAEQQNLDARDTLNARKLKAALEERGIVSVRKSKGMFYKGVSANTALPPVAQASAGVDTLSKVVTHSPQEFERVTEGLF